MRAIQKFSATLVFLVASSVFSIANAGLYIEPLVGYQMGSTDYQYKASYGGTSGKTTLSGLAYGAELGYEFSKLRIGADFQMANQEHKDESSGVTDKWTSTAYSLIVGYEFPEKIVGYLSGGMLSSVDSGTPQTTATGVILKAGASRELIKHVSVSIEYQLYTINESKTEGGATSKISDVYEKHNSNGLQVSIRIPFGGGGK